MDVSECIGKLVATGAITRAIGDEAMEFFKRSRAEYSKQMGPASADAAAALEAAKKLRDRATKNQIAIAADVRTFRTNEQRVVEDPRGGMAAIAGMVSKDTLRGDNRLRELRASNPTHPIFTGPNADYLHRVVSRQAYNMLGPAMESFKPGFLASSAYVKSLKNFIYERFGVSTGDQAAKTVSDGFGKVIEQLADRAIKAGKIFDPREDWRLMQPWNPRRVGKFSEAEFVKDYRAEIDSGGVKLWDKETNKYATPARYDDILKKAYADIKYEGGTSTPFSKEMRTFEFQPGQIGADSWLKLQAKYGVGNEILKAVDGHIDHMAREIALHETFGAHPDAQFAALMRLAAEKNPGSAVPTGLGWFDSPRTARLTYDVIRGRGAPGENEFAARLMSGVRSLVGVASLRNLPITIVPSDAAMTFLATHYDGMSGFNVLSHTFDGTMSKEIARHLQIAAHSYIDHINNFVRRYEDELNVSGLTKKVSSTVVKLTGANLWTENGRLGTQLSYLNTLALARKTPWAQLDTPIRENFLRQFGFTSEDWDRIRALDPYAAPNGAEYIDLPKLTELDRRLSERLQSAIMERSSYAFHQPDARTEAIARQGAKPGTLAGEAWLSIAQYKQFALERMTTHLMRVLHDGPIENRVARGLAFALLSMGAGAVSMQAAAVLAGKNPLQMADPHFWIRAFARGGAGGVYGDILGQAFEGNRGAGDLAAQLAGPLPGLAGDVGKVLTAPFRHELFDEEGNRATSSATGEAITAARRWSPNTWYSKLAVDRLLWDRLQVLLDPDYRQSFRRAAQAAKRNHGPGFWFAPGAAVQ